MQLPRPEPQPMEREERWQQRGDGDSVTPTGPRPAQGQDRAPLGLPPEGRSARGRHKAEGLQDGAAEPFGSSDPLFDFFSVPVPAAPVLGAAQSPLQVPAGFLLSSSQILPAPPDPLLLHPLLPRSGVGPGAAEGRGHPQKKASQGKRWMRAGCSEPTPLLTPPPVASQPFQKDPRETPAPPMLPEE